MKSRFLLILTLLCFHCFGQNNKSANAKNKYTRYVSFYIDGKKKNIDDQFSFIILNEHDTIRAKVKGHELIVSKLPDGNDYVVIFKYKHYALSFHPITRPWLIPEEDMTWEFGVDNKPFEESLLLVPEDELKADKTTCQLQYLRLGGSKSDPGRQFVNKIDCSTLKKSH